MGGIAAATPSKRHLLWVGLLVGVLGAIVSSPIAGAQEIQTVICRQASTITLTHPTNDTVVTDNTVQLSGSVRQANQVEIYVDGTLDGITPLSLTDTTYTASVQLEAGTHTIKVVSIDACQIGNGETSVVVTYQPAVPQTSVGASVPTTVGGEEGVRIGGSPLPAAAAPSILPPFINQPLQWLNGALNFNGAPTDAHAVQGALPQFARFSLVTAGALMVMFSQLLSTTCVSGPALQFAAVHLGLRRTYGPRLLAVCIGIGSVLLAFLL